MEGNTDLKDVWELQKIDTDIQNLEQQKEKLPSELGPFRQNWEEVKQGLDEMKKIFETMQVERKAKEGELASNGETIKKYNIQLYSLKSNKEYTAMLKEIEGFKQKNKKLEDEILELMEKTEQYSLAMKEKGKTLIVQEGAFKEEESRINKEVVEVESQLVSRRDARNKQKNKISPELYQKYEKIRRGKAGLGIVAIVDNSCGGCHINLPPQIVNEVKMRKVVFCGSCARLLYWAEN